MNELVREYRILQGEATVYEMPLIQAGNRRERETESEKRLLEHIFSEPVILLHSAEGAPYLQGRKEHISISHSKSRLAIVVSKQKPVGIDMEEIHERLNKVKHKFLQADELKDLPTGSLKELALCWSAKEAVYKVAGAKAGALGENISLPTRRILSPSFTTHIGTEAYGVETVEVNDDYEIVAAWAY